MQYDSLIKFMQQTDSYILKRKSQNVTSKVARLLEKFAALCAYDNYNDT